MSIYFVGGASAAGKSTVAKKLASVSYPIVDLDHFHNILMKCIVDRNELEFATEAVVETAVRQLLSSHSSCLMEGGWIKPERASKLREEFGNAFQPVFCGFPNAIASERLKVIKKNNAHWLAAQTEEFGLHWLQEQIEGSNWYRIECTKYNLTFIDFSDFSIGEAMLESDYSIFKGIASS